MVNDSAKAQSLPAKAQSLSDQVSASLTDELAAQLERAGDNLTQIEMALRECPPEQQEAIRFLILHMPPPDLQSLTAAFLLEHVALAYEARSAAKWGQSIPPDIFLNEVLPYANINEARDDVRRKLREQFWPRVKDLDSISQAAARLNHEVFQQTGVHYSTQRRRPNQGPQETLDSKIATCTGLSILLIDACRACGIPARFVGTPRWSDNSGNHSWVEVWDDGWHFTGAAEPSGEQLNQAWFVGRAAQATLGDRRHGIFAVSYRRTDLKFPVMFQRGTNHIHAVEVTARYAVRPQRPAGTLDLRFKALAPGQPQRCRADLLIKDQSGEVVFRGQTLDESADSNNHLTAALKPGPYQLELTLSGRTTTQDFVAEHDGQLITIQMTATDSRQPTQNPR